MAKFNFPCGCSFDKLDIDHLKLDCPKTWDLICEGNTVGVFQLENPLGQTWARRTQPRSIEELSDLIALLRPGCLESGMSDKYVKVKRGEVEPEYIHEALKPIFEKTYGVMVYQEQAIRIAKDLAGFNLVEADLLRKAVGKKLPEEMTKVKIKFLEGCNKNNIDKNVSEEVFGWIEKSQRYSFNAGHSIAYAINGYICAYLKTHFPLQFFCAYLEYSKDKIKPHEELTKLVGNAISMGITIHGPLLLKHNPNFLVEGKSIRFGLSHIKNMGEKSFVKLQKIIIEAQVILQKKLSEITWPEWLCRIGANINSRSVEFLICSGALDYFKLSRKQMLYEFAKFNSLTSKEQEFILHHCDFSTLGACIIHCARPKAEGGGAANRNRVVLLRELAEAISCPPFDLADNASSIAQNEIAALGLALTQHAISDFDTFNVIHSCSDITNIDTPLILGVNIDSVKSHTTKSGKNKGAEMAFMKVSDETGKIDNVVVFPEAWAEYRYLLVEGNKVCICGEKSTKNDGLIVKRVSQLSLAGV